MAKVGTATIYWIPPRATARQAFDCLFPRLMRKKKPVDGVVPLKMLAASVNGTGDDARSRAFDSNVLLLLPNLTLTLCVSGCKRVGGSFQKRMKNSSGRENRVWVRSSQAPEARRSGVAGYRLHGSNAEMKYFYLSFSLKLSGFIFSSPFQEQNTSVTRKLKLSFTKSS